MGQVTDPAASNIAPAGTKSWQPPIVALIALLAIAAILTGTAFALWSKREQALHDEERSLANLTVLAAAHVGRAVQQLDLLMRAVTDDTIDDLVAGTLAGNRSLQTRVARLVERLRDVHSISIADPQGFDLLRVPDAAVPVTTRVESARDMIGAGPLIGDPIALPNSTDLVVPFTHRIDADSSGARQLQGFVECVIRPGYFNAIFDALELGSGIRIRLLRADGMVLGRRGTDEPIGSRSADFEQTRARLEDRRDFVGRYELSSAAGGARRIGAIRVVDDYPLIVTMSIAESGALSAWRREAWTFGLLAATAAVLMLFGTATLVRRMREDEAMQRTLRDAEERWRFAMESAGHGVWDWDIKNDRVTRSASYLRVMGLTGDEPEAFGAGAAVTHPDDLHNSRAMLDACMRNELPEYAVEVRVRDKLGAWRWVLRRGRVMARDQDGRAGVRGHGDRHRRLRPAFRRRGGAAARGRASGAGS